MHFNGIIVAAITFLIIGIFHPIVVKAEYHFSKKIWPLFAVAGSVFLVISLFSNNEVVSSVLAVLGATCMWSIHELFEQEERVKKGWFPAKKKCGKQERAEEKI